MAQEKARTEKLNSLMHKVDREYVDIVNLFHFQELTDAIARNRDKLEANDIVQRNYELAEKDMEAGLNQPFRTSTCSAEEIDCVCH